MADTVQEKINQYLEDTIGAERNFEKALSTFGEAGEQTSVQQLLTSASAKAKTQHERLEALLKSRGGAPSEGKTVLAENACIHAAFRADRSGRCGEEHATPDGDLRRRSCGDGDV
jgi:ferritin-like metal-binding protein YciE